MLRSLARPLLLVPLLLAARLPAQEPAVDPVALLERVPLLAGREWELDLRMRPIVPIVPKGWYPTSGLAGRCGGWAHAVLRAIQRDYAGPAGRELPADWTLPLLVLPDPKLYFELRDAAGIQDARDARAFFLPQVPAVVVLDDKGNEAEVADSLRALLHAMTHAAMAALAAPGAAPPLWLEEGLAERLSSNTGFEPPTSAALRAPDLAGLRAMARDFQDPVLRAACLRPVRDLVALATPADFDAQVGRMTVEPRVAIAGIAREAGLLLAWLEEGEKGRRKAEVPPLVVAALTGAPVALQDLDATETGFVTWLKDSLAREAKDLDISGFTLGAAAAGTGEIRAGVAAQLADLRTPQDDVVLEHARALREAQQGELRAALARLDKLMAWPALSAEQSRDFAADRRALAALDALRARWLADRAGKTLDLVDGRKPEHVQLVEVRGDTLSVRDTRGTARELPVSAVTPGELAQALQGTGLMPDANQDEARALAFALALDAKWKERVDPLVRTETGPAGLVRLDARPALETAARTGRAAFGLEELAASALPAVGATDKVRDEWLARAGAVLADADLPLVAERAAALRALAGQVLGARFDAAPLKTLALKGKVEELPGGRVRASWDFSAPATWSDWIAVQPEVPFEQRPAGERLDFLDGAAVEDHWLVLHGTGQWRCPLGFLAPVSAEWDLVFKLTSREAESTARGQAPPKQKIADHVELRLLSDGRGNSLAVRDFGALQRRDRLAGVTVAGDSKMINLTLEKPYHFRVEYDGKVGKVLSNSMQMATLETPPPGGGYLDLWHDTGRPIAIRRLVVEGTLDPAALKASRDAWVARQVGALGKEP